MRILLVIFRKLKSRFDISGDKENEDIIIENVKGTIKFRGANLWILICAVVLASIGLNVDSNPIIIGAMLISPLMGPIIGTGLSVGINDMELMKRSLRNLLVATLISVLAATAYFLITPLNEARSELLARTSPSIYDVFIALTGGAAGFLALSTKGNNFSVIVGVAIATALMPPLCTAGFGFATGNWVFAMGALYLFFINSVFISLATYLGVRFLKFSSKQFVDKTREKKVKQTLIIISIITLCPSIYLTYNIVKETFYTQNAERFINQELRLPNTQIIDKSIIYNPKSINITYLGEEIPQMMIDNIESKLPDFRLTNTKLNINQIGGLSNNANALNTLRSDVLKDLYQNKEQRIESMQHIIDSLQNRLDEFTKYNNMDSVIFAELIILYPQTKKLAIAYTGEIDATTKKSEQIVLAYIELSKPLDNNQKHVLEEWLKERTKTKLLKLNIYVSQ